MLQNFVNKVEKLAFISPFFANGLSFLYWQINFFWSCGIAVRLVIFRKKFGAKRKKRFYRVKKFSEIGTERKKVLPRMYFTKFAHQQIE